MSDTSKYTGLPKFPTNPPASATGPRHACMGLNHCKNQGRTGTNACAGQGYCSTAIDYQSNISDHTCHVLNGCRSQGGCGLYGTADEQSQPGQNSCQMLGSCATPINAERFSTNGVNSGQSVWLRARQVFAIQVWPKLRQANPNLPSTPPAVPGSSSDPDVFQYGPTIEWIQDYSGEGMTACGSSGMSGAGSCS